MRLGFCFCAKFCLLSIVLFRVVYGMLYVQGLSYLNLTQYLVGQGFGALPHCWVTDQWTNKLLKQWLGFRVFVLGLGFVLGFGFVWGFGFVYNKRDSHLSTPAGITSATLTCSPCWDDKRDSHLQPLAGITSATLTCSPLLGQQARRPPVAP